MIFFRVLGRGSFVAIVDVWLVGEVGIVRGLSWDLFSSVFC